MCATPAGSASPRSGRSGSSTWNTAASHRPVESSPFHVEQVLALARSPREDGAVVEGLSDPAERGRAIFDRLRTGPPESEAESEAEAVPVIAPVDEPATDIDPPGPAIEGDELPPL